MPIKKSELILNTDGSVYLLNLKPNNIGCIIIFVYDPDRVIEVTKHFDAIKFTNQKRKFKTQTGTYKGKRILLGHNAVSINAIIANRANGVFSKNPTKIIEKLITYTLD